DLRDRNKRLLGVYPSFRYSIKGRFLKNWKYFKDLNRFAKIGAGDTAVLWYDDCASGYCGMLRAVHDLCRQGARIELIHAEQLSIASPCEVEKYYEERRNIFPCEGEKLSGRWKKLVGENAALRALINGSVRSVSADYYDALILKYVSDEPISAAEVLSTAYCLEQIRVDFQLLESRLYALIDSGAIECVQDGANYRELIVRRSK
ncbi:MAG: hypothetical protein IJ042_00775, partial [Butyricicoccus sp.]|nr:hypothetical protein [Butyricicoccus sp.]